jgi:hypothetical protein
MLLSSLIVMVSMTRVERVALPLVIPLLASACLQRTGLNVISQDPGGSGDLAPLAGLLTVLDIDVHSITVSWTPATDDRTPSAELVYRAYFSTALPFQTVGEVETGVPAGPATVGTEDATALGLDDAAQYYLNVVVTDTDGNKSAYAPVSAVTTDGTPPTTGTITVSNVQSHSVDLSWLKATDNLTPQNALVYHVYYSTSPSFGSVAEVEAGASAGSDGIDVSGSTVAGLARNTTYHFNIVVTDEANNKSAYTAVLATTDDICDPLVEAGCPDRCLKAENMTDTFDDGRIGTLWDTCWSDSGASFSEAGGQVVLVPTAGVPTGGLAACQSSRAFDLCGSAISLEIVEMVNTSTTAYWELELEGNATYDDRLGFSQTGGALSCILSEAGVGSAPCTVAYSPSNQRWLRIRESAGFWYWEASPDGSSWSSLASRAAGMGCDSFRVALRARTYLNVASPGQARIDNFNTGGSGDGSYPYCKPTAFTDDFSSAHREGLWWKRLSDQWGGATFAVAGGVAEFTLPSGARSAAAMRNEDVFDLRDSAVWLTVASVPEQTACGQIELNARSPDADHERIRTLLLGGVLHFGYYTTAVGSQDVATMPYDSTEHRRWRLRESGGTTYWETSPAAGPWTVRASLANPIALDRIRPGFSAETTSSCTDPGGATIDDYNIP